MEVVTLQVHGLDCAEEVSMLRTQLTPLAGVQELSFDVLRGRMTVEFDGLQTSVPMLVDAVEKTGLHAIECTDCCLTGPRPDQTDRRLRVILTATSGLSTFAGLLSQIALTGFWTTMVGEHAILPLMTRCFYLAATISGLWTVAPKVLSALRSIRPDMNLLMTAAVIGAFSIGQDSEAATVAFLFSLSLLLESWSVERARRAVDSLLSLAPTMACRLGSNGQEEQILAAEVAVGSLILVRPGEMFALDGLISQGETTVNQAPITGESLPVPKGPGCPVFAGTINEDGAVQVLTSKTASDTALAHILRLVSDAQRKRSATEQFVETFARYYTPTVMILALTVMLVPPLIGNGLFSYWFYQSLVLLVIACPCALVISTPVSIVAALTSATKQGVLVKGGRYLELTAQLRAVAFDKTGTLTIGRHEVQRVIPMNGYSTHELLSLASSVESLSQHPIARAIVRFAADQGIRPIPVSDFHALSGRGAIATIAGRSTWIGSQHNLIERGKETPEIKAELARLADDRVSIVVIGQDEEVCGLITLSDTIRPNAAASVASLHRAGIKHIVMLTGDNPSSAVGVAAATGVDETYVELLPAGKVAVVAELLQEFGIVAMVGDGVNDAPAMAEATLGIAMGDVGTDTALETADIVLMNDDLSRIPWLIEHARWMNRVVRQNIAASLAVKAGFALLTIMGHASLWAAIAADTGMSLIVVMNALRLLSPAESSRHSPSAVRS